MTFKELLKAKGITSYALAKNTGIPYTTINDLVNGKTIIQNTSLKHALLIADCLDIDVRELTNIEAHTPIEFRYFRNNLLSELKRTTPQMFTDHIIKSKIIDYYYKNGSVEYALYLLALIDCLARLNNEPVYNQRYNELRKKRLTAPFFVGSDLIHFDKIEDAEKELNIEVIPEFKKFNIIEGDIFNVA